MPKLLNFVSLAAALRTKFKEAQEQSIITAEGHQAFTGLLELRQQLEWKQMMVDWEADRNQPNPYDTPLFGMCEIISLLSSYILIAPVSLLMSCVDTTRAEIQLKLIEKERDAGELNIGVHSSLALFVNNAIDLEDLQ
jgi:hypothetical protein